MSSNVLKILITILLLVVVVEGIFIYNYINNIDKQDDVKSIEEVVLSSVDIPEITTNLADGHFVKLQLKIETDNEETALELSQREFQVKNILIQELSNLSSKEIDDKEGKNNLVKVLKLKINELFSDDNSEVENIYITSFVIS